MNNVNQILLKLLIALVLLAIVVVITPIVKARLGHDGFEKFIQAFGAGVILCFIAYNYFARAKLKPMTKPGAGSTEIKKIFLWLAIFAALIMLYAFRFELNFIKDRTLAVLIPSYNWTDEHGQLVIARSSDGHFYLNARSQNKNSIKFLVDTGASDIALTKEDAILLGVDLQALIYSKKYSTANGVSYGAPVRIEQITIGNKTFYNLAAHVTSGGLDVSLLGMSIIGSFKDFKITNDLLILGE